MEGHRRKAWGEFQFSIIVRDVQAERNKREIFVNIDAVLKLA